MKNEPQMDLLMENLTNKNKWEGIEGQVEEGFNEPRKRKTLGLMREKVERR